MTTELSGEKYLATDSKGKENYPNHSSLLDVGIQKIKSVENSASPLSALAQPSLLNTEIRKDCTIEEGSEIPSDVIQIDSAISNNLSNEIAVDQDEISCAKSFCVHAIPTEEDFEQTNPNILANAETNSLKNAHNVSDETVVNLVKSSLHQSLEHENESFGFDLGLLTDDVPISNCLESIVKKGPAKTPSIFSSDGLRSFPISIFHSKRNNGEYNLRDWLVWSKTKESLHCFPCRLFDLHSKSKSILTTCNGWDKDHGWRTLYNKIPTHESSTNHKQCYVQWRKMERRILEGKFIRNQIDTEMIPQRNVLEGHFPTTFVNNFVS
ncbi:hypothetical protein JTE90_008486 [Oedothorax gibbosus]|uniref:TTF-type domain-containing protein n=1 Tax=Oedothorax gibbosus TaxID=931172 RepID=A0AAV6UYF1_9ARAC|nr:hypothetical protein JTE90_008486 [Oedothorax gibbosus]